MSEIIEVVSINPPPIQHQPGPSHSSDPSAGSSSDAQDLPQSSQLPSRTHTTTAEAIANFKPTSQQVISGIAPHVFDERKRRRSQRRVSWYSPNAKGRQRPSPLRGVMVVSWDEHSIYLEQSNTQRCSTASPEDGSAMTDTSGADGHAAEQPDADINLRCPPVKISKPRSRYFRVDTQLLRSLIVKLKFATSPHSPHPSTKPT